MYFLIPPVIAQIFNPILELVIPKEIPTNEAKVEIDAQLVKAGVK